LLKFYHNKERIELIEKSMSIINCFLAPENVDDLRVCVLHQLMLSAYDALESALILLFNKRDFHAVHIVREVVESEYLLRYFLSDMREIEVWWKFNPKTRSSKYNTGFLRRKICGGNKELEQEMKKDYDGHSELFAHISPSSIIQRTEHTLHLKNKVTLE
jgi:hypothetical protein